MILKLAEFSFLSFLTENVLLHLSLLDIRPLKTESFAFSVNFLFSPLIRVDDSCLPFPNHMCLFWKLRYLGMSNCLDY